MIISKGKSTINLTLMLVAAFFLSTFSAISCSTFKLQNGDQIVYGHNLNEGDIGVPGLLFVNKRSVFKTGRTWDEMMSKQINKASDFCWISRYGSVTINCFGKDFPDGGMNEAGLFIWEMNEDTEYPLNNELPKLNQMHWMQYILDMCSTTEEAIQCAFDFEIDGWGWHYFVGDANGNTAAIEFLNGEIVITHGEDMIVPGLFNNPYKREVELMQFYMPYGGIYEVETDNPKVPRFIRTAKLIDDYNPSIDINEYGLMMLDEIKVNDVAEWSVLFNENSRKIFFRTRLNPEVKELSMSDIDFSNTSPVLIMDIDLAHEGNIKDYLEEYTNTKMSDFLNSKLTPLLPEAFFTRGGLSLEEYIHNTSTHTNKAKNINEQYFIGTWETKSAGEEDMFIRLILNSDADAVNAQLSFDPENKNLYSVDHLNMAGDQLSFTIITKKNTLLEFRGTIRNNEMKLDLYGIEDYYGQYILTNYP